MGGTFGYLISPAGAGKLRERASERGIQNAVDWFIMGQADVLRAYRAEPAIASSSCAQLAGAADTDVQRDQSRLE